MKLNILWSAGVAALLFTACSNRETPFIPDEEIDAPTGQLSTAELLLSVTIDDEVRTRAESPDINTFIVEIRKGDVLKHSYTYSELPEVITLPEGADYTVQVKSDVKAAEADWEAPYYVGAQSFTIEANKVTQVEKVVCKRDNVRVSVRYDEDLKAVMGDDSGVIVDAGEGRSVNLVFGKDEKRDGYFATNDSWNTLAARFVGTIDGHESDFTKLYDKVQPGDHFIITYAYSSPHNPVGEGSINADGVTVITRVERINIDGKITVSEEVIDSDGRPNDGPGDDPGNDDPKPDDPVAEGPVIEAVAPIDLDIVNEVDGESHVELKILSETGITGFTVDIDSPSLTPDELSGVGLASHLDLVNPGDLEESLKDLGFPVAEGVKDQKEVTFNITGFMELLGIIGGGQQHNFVLKVTDAGGTTEKTLKLKMK